MLRIQTLKYIINVCFLLTKLQYCVLITSLENTFLEIAGFLFQTIPFFLRGRSDLTCPDWFLNIYAFSVLTQNSGILASNWLLDRTHLVVPNWVRIKITAASLLRKRSDLKRCLDLLWIPKLSSVFLRLYLILMFDGVLDKSNITWSFCGVEVSSAAESIFEQNLHAVIANVQLLLYITQLCCLKNYNQNKSRWLNPLLVSGHSYTIMNKVLVQQKF